METAGQQKHRDSEKGPEPTKSITRWQPREASHKTHRSRQPSSKSGAGREPRHSSKFCCNTTALPTLLWGFVFFLFCFVFPALFIYLFVSIKHSDRGS